ncbi:MAG: tetratricopeptide repeat protein [Desulfobacteraceae bacterium]|nr:tetratricopeptide repeat protein [Desulfobacteraceae bacterium]
MNRWAKVVVVSFVIVFGLFACSNKEQKVTGFVEKGDKLLKEGDAVRALLEYKNAIQIDHKSVAANMGMARALLVQGDFQKAASTLRNVLELDPNVDEAKVQLAWLYSVSNQSQPALDLVATVNNPDGFQPNVDLIKARALLNLERYQEIVDLLSKSENGEKDKNIQMFLAIAYRAVGKLDMMMASAGKWRELEPKDPGSYLFLVQFHADNGDKEPAARELQKMADANPGEVKIAMLQAQTLEKIGLVEAAQAAYEKLSETPETLNLRAEYWSRRGDWEKVRAILKKILALSPDELSANIKMTQSYLKQNDPANALDHLEKMLKKDLKKSEREAVLLLKANILGAGGKFEEAKKICTTVLGENQGNVEAHFLLGKVLLSTRNSQEAEIHLNQVVLARPGDEEVNILLARCQLFNKKDSVAGDTLKKGLEANPDSERLRIAVVRHYIDRKDFEQALRLLDKGLERKPKSLVLLRVRGGIEASRNNFAKAEKDFLRMIEINPELSAGYAEMGNLMLAGSRYDDAIGYYRKIQALPNGWPEALPALARAHLLKGDSAAALAVVEEEASKHSDAALPQFLRGQLQLAVGKFDDAEKSFLKAVELAPVWPDPYRRLAEIYMRNRKLPEALSAVEAKHRQNPTSIPLCLQLAIYQEIGGKFEEAARYYGALLEKGSPSPVIINNLAYLYAEHLASKANLAKASELAHRALEMQPDNPSYLDTMAWIYFRQGDFESAWDTLHTALLISPEASVHNLHAAMILKELGRGEEALGYLDKVMLQKLDGESAQKAADLKKQWQAG